MRDDLDAPVRLEAYRREVQAARFKLIITGPPWTQGKGPGDCTQGYKITTYQICDFFYERSALVSISSIIGHVSFPG